MSKVNIFISTYNRANLIGKCIDSILAQTFKDWSLLVVNDKSTDNTLEVLKSYTKQDKRIKVIAAKENLGPYRSKASYLLSSKGKYIAILDDDDYWLPTNLEERVKVMEANSECPVCYTDCWRIDTKNRWKYWNCSIGNPFPNILSPSALLRGSTYRELDGWDPNLYYYHAEMDYYLRLGYKNFIHIAKPLAVTTAPISQMSLNRLKEAEQLDYIVEKHIDILRKDKKKLAYFYVRIGLHTIEGKGKGSNYFKYAIKVYPKAYEAWGGLLLPRSILLPLYKIYRRIKGYDSKVYENPLS